MKKLIFLAIATIATLVFLAGCNTDVDTLVTASVIEVANAQHVTVYKSPTCGCCVEHSGYLEENGFEVEIVIEEDISVIKEQYNIPSDMQSCHTAVFGDYFVEGHVPIEDITKLLEEQPDIDGIALPGMPSGSPGMPGPQIEPWVIYSLTNGESSEFMTL